MHNQSRVQQGISIPLLPTQLKHLERLSTAPHQYCTYRLCEASQVLDAQLVEQALNYLIRYHDALRLRFTLQESCWQQWVSEPDGVVPFSLVDLSQLSIQQQDSTIKSITADMLTSLNLTEGPILRVGLFHLGDQRPQQVLFIVHHLAIDNFSWEILMQDFSTVYRQLSCHEAVKLASKTTSFIHYAEKVMGYLHSQMFLHEIDFWSTLPWKQVKPLPVDKATGMQRSALTENTLRVVSMSLSTEETRYLLQRGSRGDDIKVVDILLTALLMTICKWTEYHTVLIELTRHGREPIFEDVDPWRTVAWLTTYFNLALSLEKTAHPDDILFSIRNQLRCVPNGGIGYGLLRYFGETRIARELEALPLPFYFNYIGRHNNYPSDVLLRPILRGLHSNPQDQIDQLIKCEGGIINHRLELQWIYSENAHSHTTVKNLIQEFYKVLLSLVADNSP